MAAPRQRHRRQQWLLLAAVGSGVLWCVATSRASFCGPAAPATFSRAGRFPRTSLRVGDSEDGEAPPPQPSGKGAASKTEMIRFALPALGVYLCEPIMSNIDNAFVGRFGGTAALAALGPGTTLANNLWFLVATILGSATTGLVSRAWAAPGGADAARVETSRTMSLALVFGVALGVFYWLGGPWALRVLNTPAEIIAPAASYARIRGLVSWASLGYSVSLSAFLVTRDSMAALRSVLIASVLNFIGDCLFCAWPLQTGVAGAAAATALSTLVAFALMLRQLGKKGMRPQFRLPQREDLGPVLEYAGPLFVITLARVVSFSFMSVTAAKMGTVSLAAFQVSIAIFAFFAFCGAPLTQTAQTIFPPLLDTKDTAGSRRALYNLLAVGSVTAVIVGLLLIATVRFATPLISSDPVVIRTVMEACPSLFTASSVLVFSNCIDGVLVAGKDFRFVAAVQITLSLFLIGFLRMVQQRGLGLPWVFAGFALRLVAFVAVSALRLSLGMGRVGEVLHARPVAVPAPA